jgi:predicted TIM-barrel fold metal-dependent hydrolase
MNGTSDIKVVDVDTHVIEPYDLWTSRVSTTKWGEKVPHVIRDQQANKDMWVSGETVLGAAASAAQAGWSEAPPYHPPSLDVVDKALYDNESRLKLMDEYGVYAQVLYPNVAGFGAGRFTDLQDAELSLLLLQAYNNFLTDWCAVAPHRLIPIMAVPFWDVEASIAEMKRCRADGHRGMIFSQAPEFFGQPSLGDPHWDRLWAAAQELELSVNFHIGGGDMSGVNLLHPSSGVAANYASFPVTFFVSNTRTIATLIGSGICHRFPRLKFVSVESGVGWLPFVTQALDWMWKECAVTKEHPEYDLLPSEYFKRQIYGCFWFEHGASLSAAIEILGADNILYETDFPHPTSMSPGPASSAIPAKDFIASKLGQLPGDVLERILHDNAAQLYHLE